MEAVVERTDASQVIADLGFPAPDDVESLHSVAHLFGKSKPRCGIYLLGFSDGLFYLGQATDAVKRFVQHRRNHKDIVLFSFQKCKRNDLDELERRLIHQAEESGLQLKNKVHVAQVVGDADLDDLMTLEEQGQWLDDPVAFNAADQEERVFLGNQHRLRFRDNYERFLRHPFADELMGLLGTYIRGCVPAFRRTEYSFWSLSCTPSTNSRSAPRLACLNMNVMEMLVVGYRPHNQTDFWGFMNVSYETLINTFPSGHEFHALYPDVELWETNYRAAGHDQTAIHCPNLKVLGQVLEDPRIRLSAAVLNLRLMRKGPNVYSRFHCIDLADRVLHA